MGKYISIRGWLECEEDDINKVKEVCNYFTENFPENELNTDKRKLYQSGWKFPDTVINWTAYIFYGADIREYHSDFIKNQIQKIAKVNSEITGYFLIDDHDGESKVCWQVLDGELLETEQGKILFNQ